MDADDLKDRIDVYLPTESKNDMGETVKDFSFSRAIWASIKPTAGSRDNQGVAEFASVTHKIVVRESSLPDIRTDMYFENRGLKLYVESWYPVYNRKGFMEVHCRMVIE